MFRLRLHAYVLMANHFHLLVEVLEGNLSVAMQWLQTSYSMCHGDWGTDLARYLGRKECGLGLKALGATLGGVDYATVSAAIKRVKGRLTKDPDFALQVQQIQRQWRQI